jgi:hypothetical protein
MMVATKNENMRKACCRKRLLFLFNFEDSFINDYQGLRYSLDTPAFNNFIKALAELENEEAVKFSKMHYDFEEKG